MKNKKLSQKIQSFIVSPTQIELDYKMVPYDILGSLTHVMMLFKCKLLDKKKAIKILSALLSIKNDYEQGLFHINPDKGAQLTLEEKVIAKTGQEAGLSMHTARSRNDQVMVTEMLYLKDQILILLPQFIDVLEELLVLAKNNIKTVMPGYTHMQPAKPTTFTSWCLSYYDAFLRGITSLKNVYQQYDLNPLGSVESFGTSWPIDRDFTTRLLGFKNSWELPQDAISSRGFFQLNILFCLSQMTLIANKLATDLLFFSTFEQGTVILGDTVAKRLHPITGSSVMAQKKNPDALELIKSIAPQLVGLGQIVFGILSGLQSGYSRSSREVKEYIDLGLKKTEVCFTALKEVLTTIILDKQKMLKLVEQNYSLTTDLADYIAQKTNTPYRLVYKILGQVVNQAIRSGKLLSQITAEEINKAVKDNHKNFTINNEDIVKILDPVTAVNQRKHIGGTNFKIMKTMVTKKQLEKLESWIKSHQQKLHQSYRQIYTLAKRIINQGTL